MSGGVYGVFQINGVWFRKIYEETVGGMVFYSYKECEDYAYGRGVSYSETYSVQAQVIPKRNNAVPPRKKDLKF